MAGGRSFMRGARMPTGAGPISISRKRTPRIFHLGYLLLLDALDQPDAKFGTQAARLLAAAQAAGVKTSVDVVSEDSDRFAKNRQPGA